MVVATVGELTGMDDDVMLELIIRDNKRLGAFQALAQSAKDINPKFEYSNPSLFQRIDFLIQASQPLY